MKTIRVNVAELSGLALNWAAAIHSAPPGGHEAWKQDRLDSGWVPAGFQFDEDWRLVGPIIESCGAYVMPGCGTLAPIGAWDARIDDPEGEPWVAQGPTPQIAVLRCWLMMRVGEEIDVPEQLLNA